MKLELISFKLCPFVQRAVIALKKQGIDYDITFINLMDPPEWFEELSPTGQVPVLKVDDEVIFESNVIVEFLNEISGEKLHPNDPVLRAKNRSWMSYSSSMFDHLFSLITGDKETFVSAKGALTQKLAKLEKIKSDHDYFNGDQFMMIDAAIAPFFMRVSWINEFTDNALSLEDFPKIQKWSRTLLSDKDVMESVEEDLDDVYYSNIEARGAHLSTLLID